MLTPIPVVSKSKPWVYSRSLTATGVSNPTGGMDVCFLWVLCVVRYRSLQLADHLPRGVLPSVVCLNLISKPQWWGGLGPLGLSSHEKKKTLTVGESNPYSGEGLYDLTSTRLRSRFYLLHRICSTAMIANCLTERSSAQYLINLQHLRTSLPWNFVSSPEYLVM
jgi:hypothetical protein